MDQSDNIAVYGICSETNIEGASVCESELSPDNQQDGDGNVSSANIDIVLKNLWLDLEKSLERVKDQFSDPIRHSVAFEGFCVDHMKQLKEEALRMEETMIQQKADARERLQALTVALRP